MTVVYPNDGNKLVMKRSFTVRWSADTAVDQKASYLGGVYSLRVGDEVFVRVSKSSISGVNRDPKATFFGMFALSGQ